MRVEEGRNLFNYSTINLYISFPSLFSYFQNSEKLLLWDTRANGDATKENLFYTLERDVIIGKVEWISANKIALALDNGLIEIWQIDEEGETTNSQVIKRFKQGNGDVSLGISTIFQLCHQFLLFFC